MCICAWRLPAFFFSRLKSMGIFKQRVNKNVNFESKNHIRYFLQNFNLTFIFLLYVNEIHCLDDKLKSKVLPSGGKNVPVPAFPSQRGSGGMLRRKKKKLTSTMVQCGAFWLQIILIFGVSYFLNKQPWRTPRLVYCTIGQPSMK